MTRPTRLSLPPWHQRLPVSAGRTCSETLWCGLALSSHAMTVKVVGVGTLDSYRIWVRFDDGVSGELDLAHLAELPMYQPWHDPAVFATVRVGPYGHTVIWYTPPVDVDLVAHWLYTEITGVTMPELMERHGPEPLGRFTHWQIKQWERW